MEKKSIREFVKNYLGGKYDSKDVTIQIEAGWYDWFCRDSSLVNRTKVLANKLMSILPSYKINIDTQYVFFKNNCPLIGHLYDDFRICDLKTGDVVWTIVPSSGHESNKGQAEVWGKVNEFKQFLVKGDWRDVVKFFKRLD